ncbi:DUF1592 domain-containing protein [Shewanella sp. 10N.286.45.A1]|uniref:PKD domain-containing protein n=1 Tax=Shewanella sp. 10N.286.45.A1 TaxID=3229694 RepID=UPI003550A908
MRKHTHIYLLGAMFTSFPLIAADNWQPKNYSGGSEVCHMQTHYKAKWWAGSYNVPYADAPLTTTDLNWGIAPWLPLLDSNECKNTGENTAPVANAGNDQQVQSPMLSVVLNASGSTDAQGDSLTYAWSQTSGPAVTLVSPTAAMTQFEVPELLEDTAYSFELTVSDGQATDTDTVVVNALKTMVNQSPVANAGHDQVIEPNIKKVVLNASASSDPDGDNLSYIWSQVSGPAVTLREINTAVTEFELPELSDDTVYSFQVTVSDGEISATDTVQINALKNVINNAPIADAGNDQSVQSPIDNVLLSAAGSRDVDGDVLRYQWAQISGPTLVLNQANSVTASVSIAALEQATTYQFEVTVSDGQLTATDTVSVLAHKQLEPEIQIGTVELNLEGFNGDTRYSVVLTDLATGNALTQQFDRADATLTDIPVGQYSMHVAFEDTYQAINSTQRVVIEASQTHATSLRIKAAIDVAELSTIEGLEVTKVIDGLFQARQLVWGDGYLFVGSSSIFPEDNARGNKIYALEYDYQTGELGQPIVVADNLLEPHGVAYREGDLYFSTSTVLYKIEDVINHFGDDDAIEHLVTLPAGDTYFPLDLAGKYWHQKHPIKFNTQDPNDSALYMAIGSPCNVCVIPEEPYYGTIVKIDVDTGAKTIIAKGVRNSVGFDWDPQTGDIWFTDNNRQNTDGRSEYYPGELNKINAADIEANTQPHFGFPYLSGATQIGITPEQEAGSPANLGRFDYLPDNAIYSDIKISDIDPSLYQAPALETEASTAALGLTFWDPTGATNAQDQRSFVYATHGPGYAGGRPGYEVRQVTVNREGQAVFDRALITGWKTDRGVIGKPVEFFVLPDNSLLVSDDAVNTIYRVKYNAQADIGTIRLQPAKGAVTENGVIAKAELTNRTTGVSRPLLIALDGAEHQISGLGYGFYSLSVDSIGELKPSESVMLFELSDNNDSAIARWDYRAEIDENSGIVNLTVPAQPDGAEATVTLRFVNKDADEVITHDLAWGETKALILPVGRYSIDLPFTRSAIPTPKKASLSVVATQPINFNWAYSNFATDEAYFESVYTSVCSSCHGGFAPDLKNGPSQSFVEAYLLDPNYLTEKLATMVNNYGAACDLNCQETINQYLSNELWADKLQRPGVDVKGQRQLRLLTRNEYANTVKDLLAVELDKTALPLDAKEVNGSLYGNPASMGFLTHERLNSYLNAAIRVEDNFDLASASRCTVAEDDNVTPWTNGSTFNGGDRVSYQGQLYQARWQISAAPNSSNVGTSRPWQHLGPYLATDKTCVTDWYTRTAEKLFHRPLTAEELQRYPATDMARSLSMMLVSPQFLYRRELGSLNDDGDFQLDQYEIATLLAYSLWGTAPDDNLWQQAKAGELSSESAVSNAISRMLNDDKAQKQFAKFIMETLEFDEDRVTVERGALTKELGQQMLQEFQAYIADTVFSEDKGTYKDLLTSDTTFVNAALANHYGFEGHYGDSLTAAAIPHNRSVGLLSLGAVAVAYSIENKTRLIPRGRMVQRSLLGWDQSLASGKAPEGIVGDHSTKDFWTQATGPSTECWACHQKMNDIGFAYDVLDKTGRYRSTENYIALDGTQYGSVALDTEGTLVGVDNKNTDFSDLKALSTYIGDSHDARLTFVKNYITYALGRSEAELVPVYQQYQDFDNIKQFVSEVLSSQTILARGE